MNWLLDLIPWWIYAIVGVVAVLAVWRVLGTKGALAALVAVGAFVLHRRGRQHGISAERAQQQRRDDAAVQKRDEIEDAIAGRSPDENRKRLGRWSR